MSTDWQNLTVTQARAGLIAGDFSARELIVGFLSLIDEQNKNLNAFLEVFDDCLTQAEKVDQEKSFLDNRRPLAGIPLAIKDNILIEGRKLSAASKILDGYTAVYNATVIDRLKTAGAIFLGRTNMDEFAMGGSTENSSFGPTKNPHDLTRVAGGSSGGSAAAVAAGLAPAALGSDTGGSVRQPSSFCGVIGLKPTYGAVSRYGLIAMASSFDQIGPITKTVADAEIIYEIIAGSDQFDSTTITRQIKPPPAKFRIGVPYHFLNDGLNSEVLTNFQAMVKKLESAGHEVRAINLPNVKYALACYYIIMPAEVSSNLARFDGVKYGLKVGGQDLLDDYFKTRWSGFGLEARRRIILGTYVLSAGYYDAYYGKATGVRSLIRADYKKVFTDDGVHLVLTPTTPSPAFLLGEKTNDPLQMYLEDVFTVPANLTGLPAISVPSGRTAAGLPLGAQFMADHFREDWLFAIAKTVENLKL